MPLQHRLPNLSFVLLVLPFSHGQLASGPVHGIVGLKQQGFQATVLLLVGIIFLARHEAELEIRDADQALS